MIFIISGQPAADIKPLYCWIRLVDALHVPANASNTWIWQFSIRFWNVFLCSGWFIRIEPLYTGHENRPAKVDGAYGKSVVQESYQRKGKTTNHMSYSPNENKINKIYSSRPLHFQLGLPAPCSPSVQISSGNQVLGLSAHQVCCPQDSEPELELHPSHGQKLQQVVRHTLMK